MAWPTMRKIVGQAEVRLVAMYLANRVHKAIDWLSS